MIECKKQIEIYGGNIMKVSDVICKWYIWAVVGYVIGIKLNDTLGGVAGLVIAGGIGWYIQKNYSKKDD